MFTMAVDKAAMSVSDPRNAPRGAFFGRRKGHALRPHQAALMETLLPQLFSSIDGVGELIVLHTLSSGAQPVSEAIDASEWREVLGTVAGENTILIVCRSAQARQEVTLRLTRIASGG